MIQYPLSRAPFSLISVIRYGCKSSHGADSRSGPSALSNITSYVSRVGQPSFDHIRVALPVCREWKCSKGRARRCPHCWHQSRRCPRTCRKVGPPVLAIIIPQAGLPHFYDVPLQILGIAASSPNPPRPYRTNSRS